MVENGITPSINIYNTILDAMFRRGKLWNIFLLLVDMAIEGCELDAISFDILSRAMLKGGTKRFPEAMKALELLMRNNSKRGTQLWIQTG